MSNDQREANSNDSSSMEISIIVPFDVSETYIFKAPNAACERCIWSNIFKRANEKVGSTPEGPWATRPLGNAPTFYREPFGPIARYSFKKSIETSQLSFFQELEPLEVIFFTRGIGVAVLKGSTKGTTAETWREAFRKDREGLKEALKDDIQVAQGAYLEIMDHEADNKKRPADERFITSIGLHRRRKIDAVRFPYAIVFTNSGCPTGKLHAQENQATLSKDYPLQYHYLAAPGIERSGAVETSATLAVDVGWGETTVYDKSHSAAARSAVVDAFIVAMASWFSLVLMSSLVSKSLRDSFIDLAENRRKLSDKKGQKIRLAFMDASSSSRPVSWTFRERDILLLDRISETWTTKRWWESVEERTTLLSVRHSEVAAERRRSSEKKLALLVIGLGTLTALTAIRDVFETLHNKDGSKTLLAMGIAVICSAIVILWARSDEKEE